MMVAGGVDAGTPVFYAPGASINVFAYGGAGARLPARARQAGPLLANPVARVVAPERRRGRVIPEQAAAKLAIVTAAAR